jgi:virginiamycin B lyase
VRTLRLALAVLTALVLATGLSGEAAGQRGRYVVREYPVPAGSRPHDVAPARDGGVWYTAQGSGELGWLNPRNGRVREVGGGGGGSEPAPRRTA